MKQIRIPVAPSGDLPVQVDHRSLMGCGEAFGPENAGHIGCEASTLTAWFDSRRVHWLPTSFRGGRF
jgi:hypothetical protein